MKELTEGIIFKIEFGICGYVEKRLNKGENGFPLICLKFGLENESNPFDFSPIEKRSPENRKTN